jgi:hypothetical protein
MFPYIGNVIIPTDEPIFFRGVGQPPTRKGCIFTLQLPNREICWTGIDGGNIILA